MGDILEFIFELFCEGIACFFKWLIPKPIRVILCQIIAVLFLLFGIGVTCLGIFNLFTLHIFDAFVCGIVGPIIILISIYALKKIKKSKYNKD